MSKTSSLRLGRGIALLAATAVLALSSQSVHADVVVGSFENDLSSAYAGVDWQINPGVSANSFVATGATDGSTALQLEKGAGWGDMLLLDTPLLAADVENHDFLEFDVTVPAGADGDGGDWMQVFVGMQGDGFGWATIGSSVAVPTDGSTVTLSADLSTVTLTSASTWSQLFFINQGGDADGSNIEVTIDNIRFVNAVPEPGSLAIIGSLACLVVCRRKRA